MRYLIGPRTERLDVFAAKSLRVRVPDIAERDAFLCGPPPLVAAAVAGLRAAGVPKRHIHFEDFAL